MDSMHSFELCLNTSTIRPCTLADKIRIAGEAGYQAIELWCDDVTAQSDRSLAEIRRWVDDAGLRVASMIALLDWMDSKEGPDKQAAFSEAERRMDQAAALGCPTIVAAPVPDTDELDMIRVASRYRELLEMGARIGVTPAMEFLGFFHNVFRLDQALQIARAAMHDKACIVLDPFHLYRGNSGFAAISEVPASMVAICHFNDAPAVPPRTDQRDEHRVYPGDGILPLATMLKTLYAGGYRGPLSLELFNPDYWTRDPSEVARTGLARTRQVIESAGLQAA